MRSTAVRKQCSLNHHSVIRCRGNKTKSTDCRWHLTWSDHRRWSLVGQSGLSPRRRDRQPRLGSPDRERGHEWSGARGCDSHPENQLKRRRLKCQRREIKMRIGCIWRRASAASAPRAYICTCTVSTSTSCRRRIFARLSWEAKETWARNMCNSNDKDDDDDDDEVSGPSFLSLFLFLFYSCLFFSLKKQRKRKRKVLLRIPGR